MTIDLLIHTAYGQLGLLKISRAWLQQKLYKSNNKKDALQLRIFPDASEHEHSFACVQTIVCLRWLNDFFIFFYYFYLANSIVFTSISYWSFNAIMFAVQRHPLLGTTHMKKYFTGRWFNWEWKNDIQGHATRMNIYKKKKTIMQMHEMGTCAPYNTIQHT